MSAKITAIKSREILDSRGNPTIETTVYAGAFFAVASVPSGASTGSHEALELRDNDKKRYAGKGVTKAVDHIHRKIFPALRGLSATDQTAIDQTMIKLDGTANKSRLGANAILSVSLATARLAAGLAKQPLYRYLAQRYGYKPKRLPIPLCNVINGGVHADSGLDIQEFFLIPNAKAFSQQLVQLHSVIAEIRLLLQKKRLSLAVGDEGGFAPRLGKNEKALRLLKTAITQAKLRPGKDMFMGFDAAASEFYDTEKSVYRFQADRKNYKPTSVYKLYQRWINHYPIVVIEDGCAEDDFAGWQELTWRLGKQVALVGDDLFVTNPHRLQTGIISGIANSVLIKPNQIGTLTETLEAIQMAQKFGYQVIVSHRSGETADDFIADLAVAVNADYIKAGSLARGERLAKYNRLLAIEAELSGKGK